MRTPNLEHPHCVDPAGVQRLYRFPNGYGASVVRFDGSYGYCRGLWELAVLTFNGPGIGDYSMCYTTELTGDVLGYLTEENVDDLLDQIETLPAQSTATW